MSKVNKLKAKLAILCGEMGIGADAKQAMVHEVSGGRVTSSKGLNEGELVELVKGLEKEKEKGLQSGKGKGSGSESGERVRSANTMRRGIIAVAHELGWKLADGKVDMAALNKWCITFGHGKKGLNSYKYHELPKLLTQIQEVKKSRLAKL